MSPIRNPLALAMGRFKDLTNSLPGKICEKDLYFGDTIPIQNSLKNLLEIPNKISFSPNQYIVKADQPAGLNYLLSLSPKKIFFIDEDESALEYMKLLVELIFLSDSHEEFISRVFSRSVEDFIKKGDTFFSYAWLSMQKEVMEKSLFSLKQSLNEFTQWAFLSSPRDETLLQDTLFKLSFQGKKRYQLFLTPYTTGKILFDRTKCKRLLPCWPNTEPVPHSPLYPYGKSLYGEMEPNTNTFYYGNLWLTKKETFQTVKTKLKNAELKFFNFSLSEEELSLFLDLDQPSVFYASLFDEENIFKWLLLKERCTLAYREKKGFLLALTGSGEMELFDSTTAAKKNPQGTSPFYFDTLQEALNAFDLFIEEGHIEDYTKGFFSAFFKNHPEIKTVAEVGFNAGHSSSFFLSLKEDITVLSFDIMDHDYTIVGKKYIDFTYPKRHTLIPGDSRLTIPKYVKTAPESTFDMIFIDGGHEEETAFTDIINCQKLAKKQTWVIMDDIDVLEEGKPAWWSIGPTKAWKLAVDKGLIEETARKSVGNYGLAVGHYL